ncbi:hypothetical protein ACHAWX_003666 [Stephanocyclus meneghinianus]
MDSPRITRSSPDVSLVKFSHSMATGLNSPRKKRLETMNSKDKRGPVATTPRHRAVTPKTHDETHDVETTSNDMTTTKISHDRNKNEQHEHQRRRSSTRPKLPPERYVARPSRRGLGAREGDYVFLSLFSPETSSVSGDVVVREGNGKSDGGAVAVMPRRSSGGRMAVKENKDRGETVKEEREECPGWNRAESMTTESVMEKDVTKDLVVKNEDVDTPFPQSKTSEASCDVASASPLDIESRVQQDIEIKLSAENRNNGHDTDANTWKCECGLVLPAERRRCRCRRWRGGTRNSFDGKKMGKWSSSKAAATQRKTVATCKVFQCTLELWGDEGFCRSHYEAIVKSNDCGRGGAKITWTCDCGEEMTGDKRRCGKCLSIRGEVSSRGMEAVKPKEEEADDTKRALDEQKVVELDSKSEIPREFNDSSLIVDLAHNLHDALNSRSNRKQSKQQDDEAPKDPNLCKIVGCGKMQHFKCDGLCWKHYRQHTAKFDNVEDANDVQLANSRIKLHSRRKSTGAIDYSNKKESSHRLGHAFTPSRKPRKNGKIHANGSVLDVDAMKNGLDASLRRSGRALAQSPKAYYVEDIDSDSESSEEERSVTHKGRGKKRKMNTENVIDLTEKDKNLCMFDGCRRFRRRNGYCAKHTPRIDALTPHESKREVCKFEGCKKYSQTQCDGFCAVHFSTRKRVVQSHESPKGSKQRHLDNACQTLEDSYPDSVIDDRRIIENAITVPSSEPIMISSKRTKSLEGRHFCMVVSCQKTCRTNGFCKEHNALFIENPALFAEAAPVINSAAKQQVKISESKVSMVVKQQEHKTDESIGFEEGEMVTVEPGGCPARVMKVHSNFTGGNCKYDIINIFGGREQGVDAQRLSAYSSDDILQSLSSDAPALEHRASLCARPHASSKRVMLELTRYQLLSGQDCWICTSCSLVVPSLTMSCGVCKRHPSLVPLKMGEFEEFVRCQRKKRNRLWLREDDGKVSSNDLSSSAFDLFPSYLCKFQGCVQRCQTNNDGYCESHFNLINLVKEQDRPLLDDYIYHLFEQLKPCLLTEGDKTGFYRDRDLGQPGITCKYCEGQKGGSARGGRSFPKEGE